MSGRIRLVDGLYAEAQGAGSAVVQIIVPLRRWFSPREAPSSTLTRWRHARTPADDIEGWLEFSSASGRLPSTYGRAAIMKIEREVVDEHMRLNGGQQAVAYRLGRTAMMLGTDQNGEVFGVDPKDDAYYAVAMGIGAPGLRAQLGVVHGKRHFVYFPENTIEGETVAVPEVHPAIPMR